MHQEPRTVHSCVWMSAAKEKSELEKNSENSFALLFGFFFPSLRRRLLSIAFTIIKYRRRGEGGKNTEEVGGRWERVKKWAA